MGKEKKTIPINNSGLTKFVNNVQMHEKKYVTGLVIIFIILFSFLGWQIINMNNKKLEAEGNNFNNYNTVIYLSEKEVLEDFEGLKEKPYEFEIKNNGKDDIKYRMILITDEEQEPGKIKPNITDIKYSINGYEVKTMPSDGIINIGLLEEFEKKKILVRLWLNNSLDKTKEYEYYGIIVIEEV